MDCEQAGRGGRPYRISSLEGRSRGWYLGDRSIVNLNVALCAKRDFASLAARKSPW
jgi:hypothetical protein